MNQPNPTPTEAIAALVEAAQVVADSLSVIHEGDCDGIITGKIGNCWCGAHGRISPLREALAALPPSLAGMVLVPAELVRSAACILAADAKTDRDLSRGREDKIRAALADESDDLAARLRACLHRPSVDGLPGDKP